MKSGSIFITLFACVLNVAVSSYVHSTDLDATRSMRMRRDVSTDPQHQKCYEGFTRGTDHFLEVVKYISLKCTKTYQNEQNAFDLLYAEERKVLQSFIEDKIKTVHAAWEECSKKTNASTYFKCMKSYETTNKAFLDDVNDKFSPYLYELEKVDQDERKCVSNIIAEDQSGSPALTLRRCIMAKPQAISNTTPSYTPSIPHIDFYIAKLKRIYATLKDCGSPNYFSLYFFQKNCLAKAKNDTDLRDYLRNDPHEHFTILNEIDKTENICLRHLAFIFISESDTSKHIGQLLDCWENGREKASQSEDLKNILSQLEKLYISLKNFQYNDQIRSELEDYLKETLAKTTLDEDCFTILDENIEKLIAGSNIHSNCLRYVLKKLQFGGVFMDRSDREGFDHCFMKQYDDDY